MAIIATVTEAKRKLSELTKQVGELGYTVTLTRHGKPYVVMMSASEYQSIQETLKIHSDSQATTALESLKASKKKSLAPIEKNNYEQAIVAAKGFLRGTGFNTEKYLRQKQEDIEIEESKR